MRSRSGSGKQERRPFWNKSQNVRVAFPNNLHTDVRKEARVRACVCARRTDPLRRRSDANFAILFWLVPLLIRLFKNGTGDYQETAPQRSHADYLWALSVSARGARARGGVRVFTGRRSGRRGRSLTNIGFTHWQQPPITSFHTRLASLRLGAPPTHSCVADTNPTRSPGGLISDFNA